MFYELPPEERITESFKSPYNTEGAVLSAVIAAFANEQSEYSEALETIESSKFVEDADPESLNRLAELFDLERRTGESVESFRLRLKVEFRKRITSATVPEVSSIIAAVLGLEPTQYEIEEIPLDQPATFRVALESRSVSNVEYNQDVIGELLDDISAAGVNAAIQRVTTLPEGTFILRVSTEQELQFKGLSSTGVRDLSGGVWREGYLEFVEFAEGEVVVSTPDVDVRTRGPVPSSVTLNPRPTLSATIDQYGLSTVNASPPNVEHTVDVGTVTTRDETVQVDTRTIPTEILFTSLDVTATDTPSLSAASLEPLSNEGYRGVAVGDQRREPAVQVMSAGAVTAGPPTLYAAAQVRGRTTLTDVLREGLSADSQPGLSAIGDVTDGATTTPGADILTTGGGVAVVTRTEPTEIVAAGSSVATTDTPSLSATSLEPLSNRGYRGLGVGEHLSVTDAMAVSAGGVTAGPTEVYGVFEAFGEPMRTDSSTGLSADTEPRLSVGDGKNDTTLLAQTDTTISAVGVSIRTRTVPTTVLFATEPSTEITVNNQGLSAVSNTPLSEGGVAL